MKAHLFLGDDVPRRRAAFEQEVRSWRGQISPMDFDQYDMADPQQAMRAASVVRMPPLDGPARVVVWKNLQALTKPTLEIRAELEESIPQAHPDVVLIAEGDSGPTAKGRPASIAVPIRPVATLIAGADIQAFSAPPWWAKEEQQKVVLEMATEAGVELTTDLVAELLQMVGADTGRIGAALTQLSLLEGPVTKRVLRQLLVADHADLEAFHLLALKGKTREALRLIPQFEAAQLKAPEAIIRLQNLALRTLAVSHTRAKDDAAVAAVSGIPEKQLYFRRKEWSLLKKSKAEAALSAAVELAGQLSAGRKLPLPVVLRTYLALSRAA